MTEYDFKKIEKKWQEKWLKEKFFRAREDSKKPKYYQLETFPYPSAAGLHVGHPKGYIAEDVHARFMRMNGREVLYTMGWDAFGLPTENYAIRIGKSPQEVAEENVHNFKRQVQMLGLSYDWDREINTSSPEYYKWTQWIFIKLFEKGLAYRKKAFVNWCPKDQTVLANEQIVDGCCERCGEQIEQREMEQWFFKITDYADRLLTDLDGLNWPEASIKRQKDWIGRSEGAEIKFPISNFQFPKGTNFVLIHGYNGSPEKHFFPFLKLNLERYGYDVCAPALPDPAEPDVDKQADFIKKNCRLEESTVLVGHSLGGVVALRLLERGLRVGGVILVGTPLRAEFLDGKERPKVAEALSSGFDFQAIKTRAQKFIVLSDPHDHVVPPSHGREFAKNLEAKLIEALGEDTHFRGAEEPAVFDACVPAITVFTTRPDTLYGATYLVLAPEHPWLGQEILNPKSEILNKPEIQKYINKTKHKTELQRKEEIREKTGVELKGIKAINPATREEIPIWVADYVLANVGTGAIMAVPAHDERDFEFATRHNLPIREVVSPRIDADWDADKRGKNISISESQRTNQRKSALSSAYVGEGALINSGRFTGMKSAEARWEITKFVGGRRKVQYRLRDWSVSRQRYWGVPIPIIYCSRCLEITNSKSQISNKSQAPNPKFQTTHIDGKEYVIHSVPEKDLPVKLPPLKNYRPKGVPPLASSKEFMSVKCPKCGGEARRDAETLDTFVDSSWYFLRYTDPNNDKEPFDKLRAEHWLPVDLYVIGAEHTTAHLLYARFITKFLHDIGYLKFTEPFLKLRHQGLILGEDGQKMSKRYGNVVNPDDVVGKFGADTMRLYEMFMGPFEDAQPWSSRGVVGVHRFLQRAWRLLVTNKHEFAANNTNIRDIGGKIGANLRELERLLHRTIKKVTEDIKNFKFNTAVSALMILLNEFEKNPGQLSVISYQLFVKLLHPFAPHLAQELWSRMGHDTYLDFEPWPEYDEALTKEEKITLVVQVNGKVRASFEADADIGEEKAKEAALASEKVRRYLDGREPKKVIYVQGKLINIVTD